jgi:hypothetical protein
MATWSLCGRHAGPGKPPTPVFINLENVLTVERQDDLTTVVMVGGEKVYIDTMPEMLIGAVAPAVLCSFRVSRTEFPARSSLVRGVAGSRLCPLIRCLGAVCPWRYHA